MNNVDYFQKLVELGAKVEQLPNGRRLVKMDIRAVVPERKIFRKPLSLEIDENGCWNWGWVRNHLGYGGVSDMPGNIKMAHRIFYRAFVGPLLDGLQIDHLCRNKACVNPSHLEQVTAKINQGRALKYRKKKTHCPSGHPYSGSNLIKDTEGYQKCATCLARNKKKEKEKIKLKSILKKHFIISI